MNPKAERSKVRKIKRFGNTMQENDDWNGSRIRGKCPRKVNRKGTTSRDVVLT